MAEDNGLPAIDEHWRAFLRRDDDARLIVNAAMVRTGRTEQEVLFFLLDAWARKNLTPDERSDFDDWLSAPVTEN